MNNISIADIEILIIYSIAPAALGGLVLFLWGLKVGHYKNNKFIVKFLIEILGAIITASFLSSIIPVQNYKPFVAFSIGIAWANIIHIMRSKITSLVEATLGKMEIKE